MRTFHGKQARAVYAALVCVALSACSSKDESTPEPSEGPDAEQTSEPIVQDAGRPAADGAQPTLDAAQQASDATLKPVDATLTPGDATLTPVDGARPAVDAGAQPAATDSGGAPPGVDSGPDLGQDSAGDTFLRADSLVLKAPNLYLNPQSLLETNVTADGQSVVDAALTGDDDKDGFLDLSLLLRFLKTTDPKAGPGHATMGGGRCPVPVGSARPCGPEKLFAFQAPAPAYSNAQTCTLVGTQETVSGPCFITEVASLTMQLPILGAVLLQEGQVIGTWEGTGIRNGRVRGFLPRSVAAATKLGEGVPPELALLGIRTGAPLTNFLAERELQKNSKGESGWWFSVTFTAKLAAFDPAAL